MLAICGNKNCKRSKIIITLGPGRGRNSISVITPTTSIRLGGPVSASGRPVAEPPIPKLALTQSMTPL